MKRWHLIPLAILLVGALALGGCSKSSSSTNTLKVGVIMGLTGPGSQMFLEQKDVTQMAQDWINNNDPVTINGQKYQVQCIFEDNKNTAADSVTAATQLISQDGVKFVIGGAVPDQVDAIDSVTEKNGVLYETGQTDMMHKTSSLMFSANYSFIAPLPALYDTMLSLYPNVKNVGYIVEDESGARATAQFSESLAKQQGLSVLDPQIHPWESTEFSPQWTKIMSLKPDAVDIGIKMPDSSAAAVKQGREAGFTGPMIATTSADPNLMLNMIGAQYATDFIWPTIDVNGPDAPAMTQQIVNLWKQNHQGPIDSDGINGWDTLWVLTQAINNAQSLDPAVVAKTWLNTSTFKTSRGTAKMGGAQTFGINSMLYRPCPITRLQNGKIEFVKWVDVWQP